LTYIARNGLLSQYTSEQTQHLQDFFKLLQRKHRSHMKHFFRELLQFKFGKVNLLKNKIMRKYIDKHMNLDTRLLDKIDKLVQIRDKCSL
jgi:hypothetical protein